MCIVRKQLLPYIKEKQNWSVSNCLARHLALDTQPIGAEGSPLGAKALVKLHVVEITGLSLQIPCYVMAYLGVISQTSGFFDIARVTTTQQSSRSIKVLPMVLKHTVQLMPGHTVWINVVGQSQKQVAVDFSVYKIICVQITLQCLKSVLNLCQHNHDLL